MRRSPRRLRAPTRLTLRPALRLERLEERVVPTGDIHSIQHVVIIMQENRSFDHYFGTFPGADGIQPGVCVPDPNPQQGYGDCVYPYHDPKDQNYGASHSYNAALTDIDNGAMDGFLVEYRKAHPDGEPEVMGYHDDREIPNYWAYAENYVLQDHMFSPQIGPSQPSHLYLVSGWAASCTDPSDPFTCTTNLTNYTIHNDGTPLYGWTDLTYLLNQYNVSWKYYKHTGVAAIWNPLPHFTTVHDDNQLNKIVNSNQFFTDAANGKLPQVSWVAPNGAVSEHPTNLVSTGQAWVTSLVNAVMQGPDWNSTAIFLAWDDWGGFYDHVNPPRLDDGNGYGLRVPGLVISPYAKQGYIDHQTLSFDAYLKFIEDDFINSQRLDPATDGRPDPRPSVRENEPILGDLVNDFDFTQAPRPPMLLPADPLPLPGATGPDDFQDDEETLTPAEDGVTSDAADTTAAPAAADDGAAPAADPSLVAALHANAPGAITPLPTTVTGPSIANRTNLLAVGDGAAGSAGLPVDAGTSWHVLPASFADYPSLLGDDLAAPLGTAEVTSAAKAIPLAPIELVREGVASEDGLAPLAVAWQQVNDVGNELALLVGRTVPVASGSQNQGQAASFDEARNSSASSATLSSWDTSAVVILLADGQAAPARPATAASAGTAFDGTVTVFRSPQKADLVNVEA